MTTYSPIYQRPICGVWRCFYWMDQTDVAAYIEPDRFTLLLIKNENTKTKGAKDEPRCDDITGRLTRRQVEAVELVEQGNTHAEAGEVLGISGRAVTYRMEFARNRIKNLPK
jgi:hypothetical protein